MNKAATAKLIRDVLRKQAGSMDNLDPDGTTLDRGNRYGELPKSELQLDDIQSSGTVSEEGKAQTDDLNDITPGVTVMEGSTEPQKTDFPGIQEDPVPAGEDTPSATVNSVEDPGYYESEESNPALKVSQVTLADYQKKTAELINTLQAFVSESFRKQAGLSQPTQSPAGAPAQPGQTQSGQTQPMTQEQQRYQEALAKEAAEQADTMEKVAASYRLANEQFTPEQHQERAYEYYLGRVHHASCLARKVAEFRKLALDEAIADEAAVAEGADGGVPVGDVGGEEAVGDMAAPDSGLENLSPEDLAVLEDILVQIIEENGGEGLGDLGGDIGTEPGPEDEGFGDTGLTEEDLIAALDSQGMDPELLMNAANSPEAEKVSHFRQKLSAMTQFLNRRKEAQRRVIKKASARRGKSGQANKSGTARKMAQDALNEFIRMTRNHKQR